MRSEYYYQLSLIFLGVLATFFLGVFFYQEVFPEYKIYQNAYYELEEFRSSYTGKPPPPFTFGIKQIVFEKEDHGSPRIDRCISCHVALQFSHFSTTSEDSVWKKLDEKIASLEKEGKDASYYKELNTSKNRKALSMHPLIGKETRPFEFHSMDEYGCTSCHNGNGNGLTSEKAHGPVFDGTYEEEFLGPEPIFTESDPKTDPRFARIFNHKPGHALLFQTTPIFVGGLMEAKCVQCHQQEKEDVILKHFSRGQELYISQACYACHRIDGFARGGVGPELTLEGFKYPWFIKESIVWPQADLKTSTMPNFKLDHHELEDLMTFLLAQRGRGFVESETDYKKKVTKWDAGEKTAIEMPINPAELHDLRYSMTIFATEGCAACHRLKGYESNIGYVTPDDSDWFRKLFPEEIPGSEIIKVIEMHAAAIDQKVKTIRQGSLLEEIEKKHPGLIESFYSNFQFAKRSTENERLHRVLMMYIQEYGLGRLVGPRPNWSGVYRTDEWLIEHFRKPNRHVARSIMPAFPFDDSKFYALTYMLDVLGKKNRDSVREIWEKNGFDPERAYQIYCSQCHGEYLHGNGPVAEWIYPIPKNLRNADFLRNFTRENVISSIVHGVKGTPMPPWGEVAADKPTADGIPVISENEITLIVDWIFSQLLGGEVIKGSKDVPKWQYSPKEILEEIKLEGGQLHEGANPQYIELKEAVPAKSSLSPLEMPLKLDVAEVFNVSPNPLGGPEKNVYFIKKKYFTKENIEAGQQFFEINCSVCHGIEADGSGYRAGTMFDAKPRMLSNLHWIDTRDDLRLLRSIKYGIAGTSMVPWGDQTTSLQRMQLVIFIRSISLEQQQRDNLFSTLYRVFDTADQTIDRARVKEYAIRNELKEKVSELEQKQQILKGKILAGTAEPDEALAFYKEQLTLEAEIQKHEKKDHILFDLKKMINEEEGVYQVLGIQLIGRSVFEDTNSLYLEAVTLNSNRLEEKDGVLTLTYLPENEMKSEAILYQIAEKMDPKLNKAVKAALEKTKELRENQRALYKEMTHDKI